MSIGPFLALPGAANAYHNAFITQVAESFARVTGRSLFEEGPLDRNAPGPGAWAGNFALLTHCGGAAAQLNYGNQFALQLWDCNWEEFAGMPSAATAPDEDTAERAAMMETVVRDGFVSGYTGKRISRTGRLFLIENVTIWRLLDANGQGFGVAAFFRDYRRL